MKCSHLCAEIRNKFSGSEILLKSKIIFGFKIILGSKISFGPDILDILLYPISVEALS